MASRSRPLSRPVAALAASMNAPDFDALLLGLMRSTSDGSTSRWDHVFAHINDSRNGPSSRSVLNPLLIPLA